MEPIFDLFRSQPDSSLLYLGHYRPIWVLLSVFVAIFASYAYFRVIDIRAKYQVESIRHLWTLVGGSCMGVGIWSMHFIGMLAFDLPCTSTFRLFPTVISVLPSILASCLAVPLLSRDRMKGSVLVGSSLLIGSGIGVMHYGGMAAMQIDGFIKYDPVLFMVSIEVAVLLAGLAIGLKYGLQSWFAPSSPWLTLLCAIAMGLAVSGMHYTAMTASHFFKDESPFSQHTSLDNTNLIWLVLAASGILIVVTLLTTYLDRIEFKNLKRIYPVVIVLLLSWTTLAWMSSDYRQQEQVQDINRLALRSAQNEAQIMAKQIEAEIKRGGTLTALLAQSHSVQIAMTQGLNPASVSEVRNPGQQTRIPKPDNFSVLNQFLMKSVLDYQADSITVKDVMGDAVAASNFDQLNSLIGRNYSDEDYFKRAQQGLSTQQFITGQASNRVVWAEITPVVVQSGFAGVLVLTQLATRIAAGVRMENAFITNSLGLLLRAPDALSGSSKQAETDLILHLRTLQRRSIQDLLDFKPWNPKVHSQVQTLKGVEQPFFLVSHQVGNYPLQVHVVRSFKDSDGTALEQYAEFFLIGAVGNLLIFSVIGGFVYLRKVKQA